MNINLLAQLLKELILDNDRVSLPGLGSFLADIAPAYFSQDRKTINPPFRRVFFRSSEIWNDGLLEKYYAEKEGLSLEESESQIKLFLDRFQLDLNSKKSLEMPGFGTMRSTKEGNYFFVPEKGLDIYSNAFGLEPISIKVIGLERKEYTEQQFPEYKLDIEEESAQEVAQEIAQEVTQEVVLEETTPELIPEMEQFESQEPEDDPIVMKKQRNIIIILSIVAGILFLLVLFLLFKEQIAEALNGVLYSPEELKLIQGVK